MFGQDQNRPKRDPKEVKHSNRKIVSQKELDAAHSKKESSARDTATISKGQMAGGASLIIAIIVIAIQMLGGQNISPEILESLLGGAAGVSAPAGNFTVNNDGGAEFENVALTPAAKKPYTILVYMNGTDLESKYGCATKDLQEMASSNFDPAKINLLVLTGGTANWKNSSISGNTSIYLMEGNNLKRLADLGSVSIADVSVLKEYVDLGIKNFPADKFGFVFWNHGGGTIHGYGSDQKYNGASLSISDIETAFSKSDMKRNKFEFIGFDCCLMGTLETAYLLRPYADYMIASEETEPGDGWDYKWLGTLSNNVKYTGSQIGKVIVDDFVDFYERRGRGEQATLSVLDLSKVDNLSEKFEAFMLPADKYISEGGFNTISQARKDTKSFGYTGQDRSSFDLVDIKHLAEKLKSKFKNEATALIKAVESTVVYYKNSSNIPNAFGVSTYIPYAAKEMAPPSVQKYGQIGILPKFDSFLVNFTQKLTGKRVQRSSISRAQPQIDDTTDEVFIKLDPAELDEINEITFVIWRQLEPGSDYFIKLGLDTDVDIDEDGTIRTAFDGYWAALEGQTACFYEVERSDNYIKYSTPAVLNGQDVNLIIVFDENNPQGKVMGAIPPSPLGDKMASKYLEEITNGDKLALKYFAQLFLEDTEDYTNYTEAEKWITGEEFTVNGEPEIEVVPVDDELYLYGFWIEDTQGNNYYTDFIEISY